MPMFKKRNIENEGAIGGIRVQSIVDAYGKDRAAVIIQKQVFQTIIRTKSQMNGNPMFVVYLKDPIPGRLITSFPAHGQKLLKVNHDGTKTDLFTESEVNAMRKHMPGFDKYYEIRRVGFDNE